MSKVTISLFGLVLFFEKEKKNANDSLTNEWPEELSNEQYTERCTSLCDFPAVRYCAYMFFSV